MNDQRRASGSSSFTAEHLGPAIASSGADAVVASDRDGIIQFWNPGAERIFGYGAAEVLGQSLDLIIPERLRARHWEGFHAVMASGKSRYAAGDLLGVPALRKNGTTISVEFTITPLHSAADEIIGLIAVMRDVTAKFEETKALRQKLRTLAERSQ